MSSVPAGEGARTSSGNRPEPAAAPDQPSSRDHRHPCVGIDLGTTNSLVAICDERGPRVLTDAIGRALLPSVVAFLPGGRRMVGWSALEHAEETPGTVMLSSTKRFMGRLATECREVAADLRAPLVEGPRGLAAFGIDGLIVTPQEVAALILGELRGMAERALGRPVERAVVTVPAYFDDAQRQATRDAAHLAGLEVERIVNEPTAAALAYGLGRRAGETVAVDDLGGGTFDVSILRIEHGVGESGLFEVLSTAGDTRLGGDDFDAAIEGLALQGIEVPAAHARRVRREAERVKRLLTDGDDALFRVEWDGRVIERRITRTLFESAVEPLLERAAACCRRALADAGNPKLDRAVMVGGMTRMPAVRRQAARLFGVEPYVALDPDQVVALGAAVQAAVLDGVRSDLLLLDVIPLSLGIETRGGAVAKMLMRNSTVPTRAVERFSTSVDDQTSVKIHVLQGEREMVADCRSIARFDLRGIPPMPAGIPQLEVEFLVDENGVLTVDAVERRSGRRAGVQVLPSAGLTAEEVDRMERESVVHAREDMLRHRLVDLAVNAGLDLKWITEALMRVRTRLDPAYVAELEAHMGTLRSFITAVEQGPRSGSGVDADAFQAAKLALDRASMRMHEVAITESLRSGGAGVLDDGTERSTRRGDT